MNPVATPAPASQRRLCWLLLGIGAVAATSLLLAPVEQLAPPELGLAPLAIRALSLVNPLLLMAVLVAAGGWAAPRVGLDAPALRAWLEGRPVGPVLRRQVGPALAAGAAVALIVLAFGWVSRPWFEGTAAARFAMPLATKLLYGGVVEELMLRWGAMSLLVLLCWKAFARRPERLAAAMLAGMTIAALLFAVGHLPALFALAPSAPDALVVAVLIGNGAPGVLFGWLFWRRGLEAAILAHALGHLLSTPALAAITQF